MFRLDDGTAAHLQFFLQNRVYQIPYLTPPPDPLAELERIARQFVCNRAKWPMLIIGLEGLPLMELLLKGHLPSVMCVGEFISMRPLLDGDMKAIFLNVVWLQENMTPHMSAENEQCFRKIDWTPFLLEHLRSERGE